MPKCKQWWVSKWHFLKRQLLNWDLLFEIEQSYSQQIHPPFHTVCWIWFYVDISRESKSNNKSKIWCQMSDFGSILSPLPTPSQWDFLNKEYYNPAVTYAASQHQGHLFWIVCKRPAFLSSFSRLQLIQNLAPSVAGMRQCDIRILLWQSRQGEL